ncbi:MAG: phage protein Gp36 family protein [Rhodospirillaceae bacterium]
MAWTTITASDVSASFSNSEKAAADAAKGDDKLGDVIADVVDEIRGYVAVKNRLAAGATIPGRLESTALIIIRHRFLSSLPSSALITEARQLEYNQAIERLKNVAKGLFAVEDSDGTESPSRVEIARSRTAVATRTTLKGF